MKLEKLDRRCGELHNKYRKLLVRHSVIRINDSFSFFYFFFYFSYRYSLQRTFERQTFRRGEVILTKMLGLPSEKGVYSYLKEFAPTEQSFLSNIEELLFIPLFKGIDTLSRRVTLSKVF